MGCNRDDKCLKIAQEKYPTRLNEINNDFKVLNTSLSEIETSLKELSIPDDYIGEKTKESINLILSSFSEDKKNNDAINNDIKSFVDEKINEHKGHYNKWKQREEERKRERELNNERS